MMHWVASELFLCFYVLLIVMRKVKEFYIAKYKDAILLYKNGMKISDIAKKLNVSYSAVYHWIKGLRKPEKSKLMKFFQYILNNGPVSAYEIEKFFPKHNELYHIARSRNFDIKRKVFKTSIKELKTWYYTSSQECKLIRKIDILKKFLSKIQ